MVVATATMTKISRPEVMEMVRDVIKDKGVSIPAACEEVYAELVRDGRIEELAELFARVGMNTWYQGKARGQRSGRDLTDDVDGGEVVAIPRALRPVVDRPTVVLPEAEEQEPNRPYDPATATGAGDQAYRILPQLTGMLAAEWWNGEGYQKPLGHMSAAELDRLITHYDSLAQPYLHRVKFLINLRAKMKGKPGEIVADTSPSPGQVKILWDLSAP